MDGHTDEVTYDADDPENDWRHIILCTTRDERDAGFKKVVSYKRTGIMKGDREIVMFEVD